MSLDPMQHAALADHAYDRDRRMAERAASGEEVRVGAARYTVLEHVDHRHSGYQGTMYRNRDTGDIVVAHRGSEPGRELFPDGLTDARMVVQRCNAQAGPAIGLTRRALARANDPDALAEYGRAPEVSVTGHSLGGTLAQITAHHFGLRGMTFNAYGAASLDARIPRGEGRIDNHVLATDPVSAASPHYGPVTIHAQPREIARLRSSGYHDNLLLDALLRDQPVLAAGRSFGAHGMHNFLDVDAAGRPDVSVLRDTAARRLAEKHQRMIADYRGDVEELRRGIASGNRGAAWLLDEGLDRLRQAGWPAARGEGPADVAGGCSRLDQLLAGQFDPAVRDAWSREVAAQRERSPPDPAREAPGLAQLSRQPPQPGMEH